jgi:SAM-dependent methyltransferase
VEIRYDRYDRALSDLRSTLERIVAEDGVRRVLDAGGGANPRLDRETIAAHGLDYVVLDVDPAELEKAPPGYVKVCADITAPGLPLEGGFDLVLSTWVAEHVEDPRAFHSSVLRLLAPGGRAVHLFPTLYALPFVVNRVVPERVGERAVRLLAPGRRLDADERKFPARYRWCRGPTRPQLRRLVAAGWEVEAYHGYFGHEYYRRIPPLHALHERMTSSLVRRPVPWLTAWAMVVLRKP